MNLNEILEGNCINSKFSFDEQIEIIEQLKERKLYDLSKKEKIFLDNFLENCDKTLVAKYFIHILDYEINIYYMELEKKDSNFDFSRLSNYKKIRKIVKTLIKNDIY